MNRLIFALLAALTLSPAWAADNAIILTPGTGVTERSIDIGSGVQAPGVIIVGATGVSIYGTAGSANANVITVQGAASMTPLIIQGGAATGAAKAGNPVRIGLSDGTNAQDWLTALILGDAVNGNNTGAVAPWIWNGTTWDRMPGTAANGIKAIVTNAGTFATQAAQSGTWTVQPGNTANSTPWLFNLTQLASTTLGAPTAWGSAPSGNVAGVNANLVACAAGICNANGQATMANSAPVVLASNQSVADPCTYKLKLSAPINLTASGKIITGTTAMKTYICAYHLVTATAQNIALVEGTGTVCATNIFGLAGGATAATGWNFAANSGLARGDGHATLVSGSGDANATAADVCLLLSSTGQTSGNISYVQQ